MENWSEFAQTHNESATSSGEKPKVIEYILIKIIDNMLPTSVFILTIFFAIMAFFFLNDTVKTNWALHAAELSLGVFLGLLKSKKSK